MTPNPAGTPGALPPGTFRIDREGAWRHEGQEVTHPGVLRNLYANLRADAHGHYLQVGPARISVDVDDAPFVVRRVELPPAEGDARLRAFLSDDSEEMLEPAAIWLGPQEVPYCRVKAGRFVARLSVAAWLQLAPAVEEDPALGRPVLVVRGRRIPLGRRP